MHSFTPTTSVRLADGTSKPISKVKAGDKVLATDPQTGVTSPEPVQKVIVTRNDHDFTILTLAVAPVRGPPSSADNSGKSQTLTTTWHHPFWDAGRQRWVDAHDLTPGTKLRQPDGSVVVVAGVRNFHRGGVTYDLTVGTLHTYYVLAGATPVLVHNCNKNQGIYEFEDQLNPGKTYVGKTKNFNNRLRDHIDSGRLKSRGDATCTHVCGTGDDLFVAEHLRMEELRGQGVDLSNDIASPGRKILEQRQDAEKFEQLGLW